MIGHGFRAVRGTDSCGFTYEGATCAMLRSEPVHLGYPSSDGDAILGEPYPPHQFVPPLLRAQGGCAYVWRDRPCTLEQDARLHTGDVEASLVAAEAEAYRRLTLVGTETTAILEKLFHEAVELARRKDADYGQAWKRQGYMGNTSRVLSKVERLRELVWSDNTADAEDVEGGETVEDTLLDLMNLAAMALHNVRTGNRWGRRSDGA